MSTVLTKDELKQVQNKMVKNRIYSELQLQSEEKLQNEEMVGTGNNNDNGDFVVYFANGVNSTNVLDGATTSEGGAMTDSLQLNYWNDELRYAPFSGKGYILKSVDVCFFLFNALILMFRQTWKLI